jgi:hypothetical protein
MRQNSIRREATFIRMVCTALFVLGIVLVDLSVVWSHTPVSPPSWHESGSLLPHAPGSGAAKGATTPLDPTNGRAFSGTWQVLSSCFTSDCRPGASLMATSRPHAAMSRFAGWSDVDAIDAADLHLHRVTLLAQVEPWSPTEQGYVFSSAPHRPARIAGADLSIPRPPPG